MIRKNSIFCKLFRLLIIRKSGFEVFNDAYSDIRPSSETCPSCGCKGKCSSYGHYYRNLIDFEDGKPQCRHIKITRVICECGHTHAILPDPIIPYLHYSLFYVLIVLAVYSCRLMSVEKLCDRFSISAPVLYRWLKAYEAHRREWQGLLDSTTTDLKRSIAELSNKDSYADFAVSFIRKTGFSLLQTHANPANCLRNKQYGFFPEAFNTT